MVLLGGGGHCRACIDVIEATGLYRVAGYLDRDSGREAIFGYPRIGTDDAIPLAVSEGCVFLVAVGQIGDAAVRIDLFARLRNLGAEMATVVSPRAHVSRHARLGAGTIVMHGALVGPGAVVGQNCIVNSAAIVEHDAVVGDHCHISTGAIINGGVVVGAGSFVGSGAVSKQGAELPGDSFVRALSLIR